MSTPAELEDTPDGLVARETLDGAVARVARTYAAAEDDAIRRQLVALGWTPPAAATPAPSVVPEAAVEAAASAVRKERAFSAAAAFGVPMDDVPQCAEMIARTALTAALPLLTAAPSAATARHERAVAYADDVAEGEAPVPDDYERHYCTDDGEDWPCGAARAARVPEAAVEAGARAMQAENTPRPDTLNRDQREEQDDATIATYRTLTRAALAAALPLLTAAPSATREAVEAVIFEADDECVLEVHEVRSLASRLLARFTITTKEDR